MEVEDSHSPLREALADSFAFRKHKVNYSLFYVSSISTIIMFIVLCSLTSWSVYLGRQITNLVEEGHSTLDYVKAILPDAEEALGILKVMCKHENFTKS